MRPLRLSPTIKHHDSYNGYLLHSIAWAFSRSGTEAPAEYVYPNVYSFACWTTRTHVFFRDLVTDHLYRKSTNKLSEPEKLTQQEKHI